MRIVVLLNENAGAGPASVDSRIRELVGEFAKRGVFAEIKALPGSELARSANLALQSALRKEIDAVVAAGGDGTIGTVASVLVDTGIPLGILPFGTLNHFARDLGLPLDLQGAADVIAARHDAVVDVGEVNGRIFLNNSSIGVYPFMVLERERRRRHNGLGKWPAMIWAAFKVMRLFPIRRFHLYAPGRSESRRTPCLFVGNNHYRLDLLGLGRRERLDRGELWLYIAQQQTRLSLVWFTFRALLGLTDPQRELEYFATPNAKITAKKRRLGVATDGEVEWMRPPLHYRTRRAALRVFARAEKSTPNA